MTLCIRLSLIKMLEVSPEVSKANATANKQTWGRAHKEVIDHLLCMQGWILHCAVSHLLLGYMVEISACKELPLIRLVYKELPNSTSKILSWPPCNWAHHESLVHTMACWKGNPLNCSHRYLHLNVDYILEWSLPGRICSYVFMQQDKLKLQALLIMYVIRLKIIII